MLSQNFDGLGPLSSASSVAKKAMIRNVFIYISLSLL